MLLADRTLGVLEDGRATLSQDDFGKRLESCQLILRQGERHRKQWQSTCVGDLRESALHDLTRAQARVCWGRVPARSLFLLRLPFMASPSFGPTVTATNSQPLQFFVLQLRSRLRREGIFVAPSCVKGTFDSARTMLEQGLATLLHWDWELPLPEVHIGRIPSQLLVQRFCVLARQVAPILSVPLPFLFFMSQGNMSRGDTH